MKNRWVSLARILIVLFTLILFANALGMFLEIKRDVSYYNRSYGLNAMDEHFNDGEYYEVYELTLKNKYSAEPIEVDTSEYEAFGRYFYAHLMAKMHEGDPAYQTILQQERNNIHWKKIRNVIDRLDQE